MRRWNAVAMLAIAVAGSVVGTSTIGVQTPAFANKSKQSTDPVSGQAAKPPVTGDCGVITGGVEGDAHPVLLPELLWTIYEDLAPADRLTFHYVDKSWNSTTSKPELWAGHLNSLTDDQLRQLGTFSEELEALITPVLAARHVPSPESHRYPHFKCVMWA
ncbi:MAG: hypothetical protein H0T78_05105, partial [Longispora sp.]|nr:hypothetical protein [Longispora sp. (in: high G+C Gram-positive bacteria)]